MNQPPFPGYFNQLRPIPLNMLFFRGPQENFVPLLHYQSNSNSLPTIIKGNYFLQQPMTTQLIAEPSGLNFNPGRFHFDPIKSEYGPYKMEESLSSQSKLIMKQEETRPKDLDEALRKKILHMVHFILNEFGKGKKEQIEEHRNLYRHSNLLLGLFDKLVEKFSAAAKCREDMVRFVLRKAISFLRDSLKTKLNINAKAASLALCKRYFKIADEEMLKKEFNTDDEEELLNFLLPYKKNSRNKTANTRFMIEIFASETFHQDYKEYLLKFDDILEHDNQKKIEKLVDFLMECVHRNSVADVKKYKRLPWLKIWSESTKIIAYELLNTKTWKNAINRTKKVKNQKTKEENLKVEESCVDN